MERSTKPTKHAPTSLPTAEQQVFMGTIITLTWQLLIVVLVPFIGGHYLDQKLGTAPLWTLAGLGMALLLAGLATYRGYKTLSETGSKA